MNIPDLTPLPTDAATVASLKIAALEILKPLPEDLGMDTIWRKADLFSALALRISPKETEGGMAPFVFNPIQADYLAFLRQHYRTRTGIDVFRSIRDIILKPRQMGFTTFIAAIFFLDGLITPGRNTLVITHLDKVSQKVLEIYRSFYDSLPADIKAGVRLRRASALHLELEFLDEEGKPDPVAHPPSSFMIHTSAGLDLRGITIHNLHCSEAAFYDNWAEIQRGLFQAVPSSGNVILESTANGFNHYKDLVDLTLGGSSPFHLVFYPWFAHPEYSSSINKEEAEAIQTSLDQEEKLLRLDHGVDIGQIAWRRRKLAEMGGFTDSFRQEYPANVQDAFISSGRPVFDLQTVSRNWELAKRTSPIEVFEDGVEIYLGFEPGMEIVGGADPSEGIDRGEGDPQNEIGGTDYSSAFFLDARTLRTVAHLHGRWEPVEFARKLAKVGIMYDAMIAVERNNHGHLVLYALEEAGYPRLYRHLEYDAAGQEYLKLGFPMTSQTKPLVTDSLVEVIRRDALPCSVHRFWSECTVFVRDPAGKTGAMSARHDDRVMSMAIAVHLCTIGSKSWGGSGLIEDADDSTFPRGRTAQTAAKYPNIHFAPPMEPISLSPGHDEADSIRTNIAVPTLSHLVTSPLPPLLNREDILLRESDRPTFAHPILEEIYQLRQNVFSPSSPRCGSCAQCVSKAHQHTCALQLFMVKTEDPGCDYWEPKQHALSPDDFRMDIGGPVS
jgi:hypothetical protein